MADKAEKTITNYKQTRTYQNAKYEQRKRIEAWRKEENLDDTQTLLLLSLEDCRNLTKEEKKASNRVSENICVVSVLFFILAYMSNVRSVLLFACGTVMIAALTYVTGIFNPVTNTQRRIRKQLKQYPAAKSFHEWEAEHPQ